MHHKDEAMGARVHAFEQRRPSFKSEDWDWGANMLHSLERQKTGKNLLAQSKLRATPGGGNRRLLPVRRDPNPPPCRARPLSSRSPTPPTASPVTPTAGESCASPIHTQHGAIR
jgi:hypothetical protein